MEVMIINGSPRTKGSCSFISNELLKKYSTEEKVDYLQLNKLNYKGCQACYSCKKNADSCIVKDDIEKVLKDIQHYDLIIILSPNYYCFISGQLKLFLDRWFCLKDENRRSRFEKKSKVFFILTQGSPNADISKNIMDYLNRVISSFNLKFYGYTVPSCSKDNLDMMKFKIKDIFLHMDMFE